MTPESCHSVRITHSSGLLSFAVCFHVSVIRTEYLLTTALEHVVAQASTSNFLSQKLLSLKLEDSYSVNLWCHGQLMTIVEHYSKAFIL